MNDKKIVNRGKKDKEHIIKETAKKLADYNVLINEMNNPDNYREVGKIKVPWNQNSLSMGLPGISMAFSELIDKYPNEDVWEQKANEYLGHVVSDINQSGCETLGLHNGLSGLGLAITGLANKIGGYKKVIDAINSVITGNLENLVGWIYSRAIMGYDVISGAVGIVNYLLWHVEDASVYRAVCELLDALVSFTEDIDYMGHKVNGWLVPSEYLFTDEDKREYPDGAFNTGYAHGIAGVLGLLCKAWIQDIKRPSQVDAIKRILDFYDFYKIYEDGRYIWKGQIGTGDYLSRRNNPDYINTEKYFRRDAWCYGAPGISYAMLKAAEVLADKKLSEFARDNLKLAVQGRKTIFSSSFCHGYAGLLQILKLAERYTTDNFYGEQKSELEGRIIDNYSYENNVFGFKDKEYEFLNSRMREYNEAGLLNGSTGIILALQDSMEEDNVFSSAFGL